VILFPDLTHPIDEEEWMDTRPFNRDEARRALGFLAKTNDWFGGVSTILRPLETWSRRWHPGEPVHVLDVGTGGADIPMALVRWARKKGISLRVTALELVPEIAAFAKEATRSYPEITVLDQNLWDLPKELTFDYLTASLFLHHIPISLRVETLSALDRRARQGLVVSDLHRTPMSYWGVAISSWIWGDSVVRHDGPLSVRRSFRVVELATLAQQAGVPYLKAQREPWFRISLSGEKS
jgi:2-polyprenyl-3-methyl-5-hydroxy-6-metoxy-1,4-benzoquinol methylase